MKHISDWFGRGSRDYPLDAGTAGRLGEELAVEYILKKGYRLVGQNVRCGPSEIDIIALDGDMLCFIEVKCRKGADQGEPEEFVDSRKQQRLVRGAACFHARDRYCQYRMRFDVISVLEDRGRMKVQHLENAFEVDP